MKEKTEFYSSKMGLEYMGERTVESNCPVLASYLKPGLDVVDLGCGPGGITVDIASKIQPGSVIGVDVENSSICYAKELASRIQLDNVMFEVSDVQQPLCFEDDSFDLAICVNSVWLIKDIVRALEEWRRVTRPNGYVVANIEVAQIRYPDCPAVEECERAHQSYLGIDANLGGEAFGLFSQAGFEDVKIDVYSPPEFSVHPGLERFDQQYVARRTLFDLNGPLSERVRDLIKSGLIVDEKTVIAAADEWDVWHSHPHAYYSQVHFLVAGRAS